MRLDAFHRCLKRKYQSRNCCAAVSFRLKPSILEEILGHMKGIQGKMKQHAILG